MTNGNPIWQGQRRLKILLIRADGIVPSPSGTELTAAGHLVIEATGSDDASRIVRNRPVNLILVEGRGQGMKLDIASRLRDESGRLSARYTPVFLVSDRPLWQPLPDYIDGVVASPLDSQKLLTTYLEFLSDSISGAKRGKDMADYCAIDAAIDRLGGDVELYKDLVDRFLDDSAGTRARIEGAIHSQDSTMLRGAAHSLKGLASSVGATAAAATLGELEAQVSIGDLAAATTTWSRFQTEMEKTTEELAPYYRPKSAPSGHPR
jgi:HPt (histidine-containing phosphotransfer) domain-containing protein